MMMGHDATSEFCCSVIYRNAAVVETKRLGASDCTCTQFANAAEQMCVKIEVGVQAYGGHIYPQIMVVKDARNRNP